MRIGPRPSWVLSDLHTFFTGGSGKAGRHVAPYLADHGHLVTNIDMSVAVTTQEIRDRFYNEVEARRDMGSGETFYAIDGASDLLGHAPLHSWRDVVTDLDARPRRALNADTSQ